MGQNVNSDSEASDEREELADAVAMEALGRDGRLSIVGLGASAGGLGALEEFFQHMPADSGLAFVVVTHQHAGHTSLMAELLGRKTAMPVVQVATATLVEPNHVYTVQPGYSVAMRSGVLQPTRSGEDAAPRLPIDHFFRSLAHDQKERAIGIVLSGTGTDGSLGLGAIKGELGMVMVQDEQSAQYSGMPHSAIATALVDYVLPVSEMPEQLLAYVEGRAPERAEALAQPTLEVLPQIFTLIREHTGHDFSQYKPSTVGRRVERRMNVHHLDSAQRYVRYLQANPAEVDLLFKELLIGVTSFFRDPEAWDVLSSAIGGLLANKLEDCVVRTWVAGCSTGEEAYSLAIVLREAMDALERPFDVQIFATDLDAVSIDVARAGAYPVGIASDISPERLARFFTREEDTYRVKKVIREMVVFAPQNLVADPPFTKLDVIVCRNLLIYLQSKLQRRLLPTFHYSLKRGGLLLLGSSESIGAFAELFSTVDNKWKVFRRNEVVGGAYVAEFSATIGTPTGGGRALRGASIAGDGGAGVHQVVDRMLLKELVPPTVLVHERGDVVHVHGRTGLFLEPAQGPQSNANIFRMAREGLQLCLSAAIRRAADTGEAVVRRGVQIKTNGDFVSVDVSVAPIVEPESLRGLFRISFERTAPVSRRADGIEGDDSRGPPPDRVLELERELHYAREHHQDTIIELETANEEFKSLNEEMQSTNEELQSANEELETSKEEMQSLNEELLTVNAELQGKVDELSRANNDMKNLLNNTDIATVFLDTELRIKRYTDQARKVIRLIPTDVGRYVGDLVTTLRYDRLVEDAGEVLRTLVFKDIEVQGQSDEWYLTRILPYRTTENVIDGLVLTFVDVTKIKSLQDEQQRLFEALRNSPAGVFGQDREFRMTWAFGPMFGRNPTELIGKSDRELFQRRDAERLREVKDQVLASGRAQRRRVDLTVHGEPRTYDLYVEPRCDPYGEILGLSCVAVEILPA